jgi:hypothetical protein
MPSQRIIERVFTGHDNAVVWQLKSDGAAVDIRGTTRCVLSVGDVDVDSSDPELAEGTFDWSTDGENGVLTMNLGDAGLSDGTTDISLTLYDTESPDGIVWVHPQSDPRVTLVVTTL